MMCEADTHTQRRGFLSLFIFVHGKYFTPLSAHGGLKGRNGFWRRSYLILYPTLVFYRRSSFMGVDFATTRYTHLISFVRFGPNWEIDSM